MKYDDLSFTITDIDGKDVRCEILSLIPKDDVESYVVYTNRDEAEKGDINFYCGKLIRIGDEYELKGGLSEEEFDTVKKGFHEDLKDYSHYIINNKKVD